MPGQPVHFEIPADDTAKGREFWGSLFDWQFEASPGPFEYHMTRISDQAGLAITNMEPGKRGIRTYFYVDDINAGAARVRQGTWRRGERARLGAGHGLVRDLQGPPGERLRPLAERPLRPSPNRVDRISGRRRLPSRRRQLSCRDSPGPAHP
jgi:hypothetical protein